MNRISAQILRSNAANGELGTDCMEPYRRLLASIVLLALKDLDGARGPIERSKSIYFLKESKWGEQVFEFLEISRTALLEKVQTQIEEDPNTGEGAAQLGETGSSRARLGKARFGKANDI